MIIWLAVYNSLLLNEFHTLKLVLVSQYLFTGGFGFKTVCLSNVTYSLSSSFSELTSLVGLSTDLGMLDLMQYISYNLYSNKNVHK